MISSKLSRAGVRAVRFEPARDLAVVVQLEAPVLEIVVHADTKDLLAPDRVAHRVHRLVHERHPLLERRAAVSVLPAVRLRVQEVGEEVVHADGKLDPVQIARHRSARRGRELLEGLLDLRDGHRVGNELGGGEIWRRHRRWRHRRPPEKGRPVRDPPPAMPELGKERHLICMGRRRHPLVHRHDAVVVAREREGHFAVVVRHGVSRHHDADPALRPLTDVVHVPLGGEAVSGLEVRGMAGVHDPVLQRVRPDGDGAEQMGERIGHDGFLRRFSVARGSASAPGRAVCSSRQVHGRRPSPMQRRRCALRPAVGIPPGVPGAGDAVVPTVAPERAVNRDAASRTRSRPRCSPCSRAGRSAGRRPCPPFRRG